MAVFVDRVAAKPNRYKIILENGDAFYAVLERADEPIVEGTMLNAETLNNIQPDPYLTAVIE